MGRPKLLLPFGETTVIGCLLETLTKAEIETLILIRPGDDELRAEIAATFATIVEPTVDPPEMRISVEHLLRSVERSHHPEPTDGWLLIPADHPLLQPDTLKVLVETWRSNPASIVLPLRNARRGHPTIFPWKLADEVVDLPANMGVNQLLFVHARDVLEVPVDDPTVTLDLDTPADYERALRLSS